jgi:Plasmid pRiA4b ORF-3-like protein
MLVGPSHTFGQFADAINAAFARWDLSHLHEFELADGRRIVYPSDDYAPDLAWEDQAQLKMARELKPGDEFEFVFDFGDDWRHRCRVLEEQVDPEDECGPIPDRPVPIWGWGWIPDQYGRESFDE